MFRSITDTPRIPFPSHTTALAGARPPFTVGLVTRAWLLANAVQRITNVPATRTIWRRPLPALRKLH